MTAEVVAARFVVRGHVQGVFFRASTKAQAARLGVRGHARNCADGSVEVLAVGYPDAVDALAGWLAHGPPAAAVTAVERQDIDPAGVTIATSFEVIP